MPDYDHLRNLLQDRIRVIADTELRASNPEKQLSELQRASEAITTWHADNRSTIPAQLNHFLKQSSLAKALDYLDEL